MDKNIIDNRALHIAAECLATSGVCAGDIDKCRKVNPVSCTCCILRYLRKKAQFEIEIGA